MLFKLLTQFLIQVWDFRICGYTFVAGRSNRVNTFKNSAGEVLRKTVDYLKPLGKTVTQEEAKLMVRMELGLD